MADTQTASTSPSGSLPPDMLNPPDSTLISGLQPPTAPQASLPQSSFDPIVANLSPPPTPAPAPSPSQPPTTPPPAAPPAAAPAPPSPPGQKPASAPPAPLVPPPPAQPHAAAPAPQLTEPPVAGASVNWAGESDVLKQRVDALYASMPPELRAGTTVESGFRTHQQQVDIYAQSDQGQKFMAASPGHSHHEQGTALDWHFGTPQAKQWLYDNAPKFGLAFPFPDRDSGHMQLAEYGEGTQKGRAPQPGSANYLPELEKLIDSKEGGFPGAVSTKGAEGTHQILLSTAQEVMPGVTAEQLQDPKVNDQVFHQIVRNLSNRYPGDPQAVMVAYNAGPGVADKWLAANRDPSVLPAETQKYIGAVDLSAGNLPGYQQWKAASDERKSILQQEIGALQKSMADMQAGSPEQRALADQLLKKQMQLMDTYEKMIQHPPTQKPRDMISNFGSLATLIGIFAGRFANRPMVASLNAAGAAMEAMNNNDRQAYTDAFNQWKVQTDMTSNLLGMESNVYKGIMEDKRLDLDEKFKMLEMQMKIFDNQQGIAAAQMGDYEKMWEIAQKVQTTKDEHDRTVAQIREANDRADEAEQKKAQEAAVTQAADADDQAWLAAHPEANGVVPPSVQLDNLAKRHAQITEKATPQAAGEREVDQAVQAMDQKWLAEHPDAKGVIDPAVHWQNYLKAKTQLAQTTPSVLRASNNPNAIALQKFMDENPAATAKDIRDYIQSMHPGRSGPAMAVSKYLEEHPGATSTEIANYYATLMAGVTAERYWSTGEGAKTVRSLGVSIDHLAVLDDAAKALQNGESQTLNTISNKLATEFGDPRVPNFNAAKDIVGSEVTRAIQGGAGALTDREELRKNFDAASTPEQLAGVIQTLKRLMAGQLAGQRRQYMTSTGRDDFDERPWLSDVAKKELETLPGEGGAGAQRLPADLPSPQGHAEGSTLTDEQGHVVAKIQNGQWVPP